MRRSASVYDDAAERDSNLSHQGMRLFRWGNKPGALAALAVLGLALLGFASNPFPLHEIRLRGFDMMQRLWPNLTASPKVQIVAIDEDSLKKLGQWPWPRSLVAELVGRIAVGRPAALGIDILFAEPDRFSPPLLAQTVPHLPPAAVEALAQFPASDAQLADAIALAPTVLGAGPSDDSSVPLTAPRHLTLVRQIGGDPRPFLRNYKAMVRSLPQIERAASGEGAISADLDDDGLTRAVPLLTSAGGQLIPAFAVEALRVALGAPALTATTGPSGIESLKISSLVVGTDPQSRIYPHFEPPSARYISAAEVLDPSFDTREFTDHIVLLGVTALGILDQKTTPLGLTQGIEIHAQLIEAMLSGSLLRFPPYGWAIEALTIGLAGCIVILLVRYDNPALAAVVALSLALALLGGEMLLFRLGRWMIDGVYPAFVTMVVFATMLGGHLRAAQIARRRLSRELERERERAARMEGELAAARVIQMGLLPRHFPAFPERTDLDLYAMVEPARVVGGDLFDFLLIDATHLFFIIADVAGKGIPAALFMAMTKEIVRGAVQRHGYALDEVLADANSKTVAASVEMDMMFVTAFTGILDLTTGDLTYASAGHDRPFVIERGRKPRQLETIGGPPLGVVDDFPFPIEYDRLEQEAVLVLYTDGVTEAQDGNGQLYSLTRLTAALGGARWPGDAQAAVETCLTAVRTFVGGAEQADDITMLAIRRIAAG